MRSPCPRHPARAPVTDRDKAQQDPRRQREMPGRRRRSTHSGSLSTSGRAPSYELLEGSVEKSHISRDNPLNHDSQDHNVHVRPDPPFQHLLRGSQTLMEVE